MKLLSDVEIERIYGIPEFNEQERAHFFTMGSKEKTRMDQLGNTRAKLHFILQLGYFKAKHLLFDFTFYEVREDVKYNMTRYFPTLKRPKTKPSRNIIASNNKNILKLLDFKDFSRETLTLITDKLNKLTRQLNKPFIIFSELLLYLEQVRIVFPAYSTLQDLLGKAIMAEEARLCALVRNGLTHKASAALENLFSLKDDKNSYALTSLKRYPKNFNFKIIEAELEKQKKYYHLYKFSKRFLPSLEVSPKNIDYYASLVEHYQVQSLKRFSAEKRQLYLICYVYHRFQSMNDQLIQTFLHYVDSYKKDARSNAILKSIEITKNIRESHGEATQKLLYMYFDKKLGRLLFKKIQKKAIDILPQDKIIAVGEYMSNGKVDQKRYEWEYHGNNFQAMIKNLRPLIKSLDFQASADNKPLLEGVQFIQSVFRKGRSLSEVNSNHFPLDTIPAHLKKYLLHTEGNSGPKYKKPNAVHHYRYEFHIYEMLKKQIDSNVVYVNDTTQYKSLSSDLGIKNWKKNKKAILSGLDLPRLNRSATEVLQDLKSELESLIISVNAHIANGENKHIKIKGEGKNRTWTLPYQKKNRQYNNPFYDNLPPITISNVLDFVEEECSFMEAFTHIKPHYAKKSLDVKGIKACLIANATSLGIFKMGDSSDLSYPFLSSTERNYIRLETLREANDIINRKTSELSIFSHYNVIENILHGSGDGQKIRTRRNTFNSRYSPKYYGLEKGVAPYSLVFNHLAANCLSRGTHEHESHCLWETYRNNTSGIDPNRISTDTEGSNQVNFVIFYFKGVDYAPCYRRLSKKTENIFGFNALNMYNENYLIKPSQKVNEKIIIDSWSEIQAIMASLMSQESSPSVIVRKFCSHLQKSKTKNALWELNNILRSIYLLRYVDDPLLRRVVRVALNRGEGYHALRRKIGETNGSSFRGASDLEVSIWNECARLVANAIIFYNMTMLSRLMEIKESEGDSEAVMFIRGLSPIASQHIIFTGRYEFNEDEQPINMAEILGFMKKILSKHVKN